MFAYNDIPGNSKANSLCAGPPGTSLSIKNWAILGTH